MNDEKQMILEMLKEGKITVEEANSLLDAIGGKKTRPENDFISKLTQSIDNVIKKTTETIGNIDFENIDINQYNIKGEINTHKEMRIEDDINHIKFDIPNGKIAIERAADSAITVTQDIWAKKGELLNYLDIDIDGDVLIISKGSDYNDIEATAIVNLALGKNLYDSLNIDMVNGSVEVADVDFNYQTIDGVNTKVTVINSAGNIDIDNVNGKIDIKNTNGKIEIDNVNGQVYLSNISGDGAKVDTISGNIRVDGLNAKDFTADTQSGSIRIYNIVDTKSIDIESSMGNIVIDTETYSGDVKANVISQGLNLTDKFKNKITVDGGYEVSTNIDRHDLMINAETGLGKINLR